MVEKRMNIKLSSEAQKEKEKFFRLCSSSDKNKLTGKEEMSVNDFQRIMFLLGHLGLNEYETYVGRRFDQQLFEYSSIQDWLSEGDYSFEVGSEIERIEVVNEWIRNFCEHIPHERTRKQYMKKYVWDME